MARYKIVNAVIKLSDNHSDKKVKEVKQCLWRCKVWKILPQVRLKSCLEIDLKWRR